MKLYRQIVCVFALAQYGCVNKPFQPVPDPWELWSKKGETVVGVRTAMLECGYDLGYVDMGLNDIALSYRCMEKEGFDLRQTRYASSCDNYPYLPACKLSIKEVPVRDVTRRINSKFCMKYHDASICQP